MEFIKLNWYINDDSSFISFDIKWWDNQKSIGDQVWFSEDWTKMEILDYCDSDIIQEVKEMFTWISKRAFIWAMMRMWVIN